MRNLWYAIFLVCWLAACTEPLPQGVDSATWKANARACKGERLSAWGDFKSSKEGFVGASEKSVLNVLGMPDRQELYLRNQRVFYYYITPGRQCSKLDTVEGRQIYLRISATNKVTEINEYRGL